MCREDFERPSTIRCWSTFPLTSGCKVLTATSFQSWLQALCSENDWPLLCPTLFVRQFSSSAAHTSYTLPYTRAQTRSTPAPYSENLNLEIGNPHQLVSINSGSYIIKVATPTINTPWHHNTIQQRLWRGLQNSMNSTRFEISLVPVTALAERETQWRNLADLYCRAVKAQIHDD